MFYQPQLTPVYVTQGPPVYFNQLPEEYPQNYAVDQGSVTDQSFEQTKKTARFSPYKWFLYFLTLVFLLTVLGLTIAIICRANKHHNVAAHAEINTNTLLSFNRNRAKNPIVHLVLNATKCPELQEAIDVFRFPPTQANISTKNEYSPYLNGKYVCAVRDGTYVIADTCPTSASNRHGRACSSLTVSPITKVSLDAAGNLLVERTLSEDPVVDLELVQNGRPCADPRFGPKLNGKQNISNYRRSYEGCGGQDFERSNLHQVEGFKVRSNDYFAQIQQLDNTTKLNEWYPNITTQSSDEYLYLYYERKTPYPVNAAAACQTAPADLRTAFDSQVVSGLDYYLWQVKVFAAVALAFACLAIVLWLLFAVLRKHLPRRYLIVYLVAAIVALIIIILGIWYFAHGRYNQGFINARTVRDIRRAGCLDSFGVAYKNAADSLANSVRHFSYVNPLIIALFVVGIIYLIVLALGLIISRKF